MIGHLDESIITGTREISGSPAIRFRNVTMACSPSSIPSSILISIICAPFSTCSRATLNASSYCSSRINRLNFAEPVTLVLSPTFTNNESLVILHGSRPLKRVVKSLALGWRGGYLLTALAMAVICAGVVPQQPPIIFKKPFFAHSSISPAISSGVSSYSPNSFGKPAFG